LNTVDALRRIEAIVLGESAAIREVRREILGLARMPVRSVLVVGETGVGKDLVPQALHAARFASGAPLEIFHCPAVPADHLESELFGTTRSAYPGAADRAGAAERADGGILFLDEIAATSVHHQAKLLRLLENREGRRLGAARGYRTSALIVAATNEDLTDQVLNGTFRADLYHRLVQDGVVRIPPLRARVADIEILAARFLGELPGPPRIAPDAIPVLRAHPWRGNVRELRAVVRTAARLGEGLVDAGSVGEAMRRIDAPHRAPDTRAACERTAGAARSPSFHGATQGLQRQLLIDALASAGGNQTVAGLMLGLHQRIDRREPATVDFGALALAERKRAHRKFSYWWQRLVEPEPISLAGSSE
jgi:anaerobic nitric oxide reductase transcription regulator